MEERNIGIGTRVEIKLAYSMETGDLSIQDGFAGCEGWVTRIRGQWLLLELKGTGEEIELPRNRCRAF
jgi:hypothetical protein